MIEPEHEEIIVNKEKELLIQTDTISPDTRKSDLEILDKAFENIQKMKVKTPFDARYYFYFHLLYIVSVSFVLYF
jgi:hypothetical protein